MKQSIKTPALIKKLLINRSLISGSLIITGGTYWKASESKTPPSL